MINVLVIDHAAGSVLGIRTALRETQIPGFEITFLSSYREIIDAFRANHFDVCLIDSASGNGLRLFVQARSLGFEAPVVLVTSNDAREAMNAISSGASDCLLRDELTAAGIERMICSVVELERELNQQQERARRYLALVDNADEIIFTQDLEGRCTSMNLAGEQLMGWSQGQWMGLPVSEFLSTNHRGVAQQIVQRTLDSRRQTRCQIEVVSREGQRVLVEARLHLVYLHGKAVEVQWAARLLSSQDSSSILRFNRQPKAIASTSQVFSV